VQVPLMGEIYSTANRVIMWLGENLPREAVALDRARRHDRFSLSRGQNEEAMREQLASKRNNQDNEDLRCESIQALIFSP
jgi:hypothetical protein